MLESEPVTPRQTTANNVASALAGMMLEEQIRKGRHLHIPSLDNMIIGEDKSPQQLEKSIKILPDDIQQRVLNAHSAVKMASAHTDIGEILLQDTEAVLLNSNEDKPIPNNQDDYPSRVWATVCALSASIYPMLANQPREIPYTLAIGATLGAAGKLYARVLDVDRRRYTKRQEAIRTYNLRFRYELYSSSSACGSEVDFILGSANHDPHPGNIVVFDSLRQPTT